MSRFRNQPLFIGLDIGSTKVACVVGAPKAEGSLEIVGVGKASHSGLRQGVVVNIESVTAAILKAKEEAELMAGVNVSQVWLSVGGAHIESFDSMGMVAIRNGEVTSDDIEKVIEVARAVMISSDRQVIHVVPRNFTVDQQDGIADPIGMSGVRLEASVHIITGLTSALHNSIKCIEKAGLKIQGLVLQQMASARACLTQEEKNSGVVLVDIGGSSCDLIFYQNGGVLKTSSVPVGGVFFTQDVAMGLKTTQADAENLKKKLGQVIPDLVSPEEMVEVQGVGGREKKKVPRKTLCEIIEARSEETLKLVADELKPLSDHLPSGVAFAGGGSLLNGFVEMSEYIFDVPVRRGIAREVEGLTDVIQSPIYLTAVGLLLWAQDEAYKKGELRPLRTSMEGFGESVKNWMSRWKDSFLGYISIRRENV